MEKSDLKEKRNSVAWVAVVLLLVTFISISAFYNNKVQTKFNADKVKIEGLQGEKLELTDQLNKLQNQNQFLNYKISDMESDMKDYDRRISEIAKEKQKVFDRLLEVSSESIEERRQMQSRIDQLQAQVDTLRAEKEQLAKDKSEVRDEALRIEDLIDDQNSEISRTVMDMNSLILENQQLKSIIETYKAESRNVYDFILQDDDEGWELPLANNVKVKSKYIAKKSLLLKINFDYAWADSYNGRELTFMLNRDNSQVDRFGPFSITTQRVKMKREQTYNIDYFLDFNKKNVVGSYEFVVRVSGELDAEKSFVFEVIK